MSKISVEGMEFFAYHGCFEEEQIIGTRFLADVELEVDTHEAEISDDLQKTVNYQSVFQVVKSEMLVKSRLLEHLSRRIIDRLFREFPGVNSIRIKLSKMNPPVGGNVRRVSFTLSEKREVHKL
jgi:dihydroneopterin aldolase